VVAFGRSPNFRDLLIRAKLANNDSTLTPRAAHSVATLDMAASPAHTLTMGKLHTVSSTQEKQDKLNITLLVTQQT